MNPRASIIAEINRLEQVIADAQAKLPGLHVALEVVGGGEVARPSVHIDAENMAAHVRPRVEGRAISRGRQKGAISKRWQRVYRTLYKDAPEGFTPGALVNVVFLLERREIRPSEAERQLKGHAENGYVELFDEGLYRVTEYAADKFGFKNDEGPGEPEPSSNVGDVAERSIAPDSKSGGASPEKLAPVGSNPTVSAPKPTRTYDLLRSSSMGVQPLKLPIEQQR